MVFSVRITCLTLLDARPGGVREDRHVSVRARRTGAGSTAPAAAVYDPPALMVKRREGCLQRSLACRLHGRSDESRSRKKAVALPRPLAEGGRSRCRGTSDVCTPGTWHRQAVRAFRGTEVSVLRGSRAAFERVLDRVPATRPAFAAVRVDNRLPACHITTAYPGKAAMRYVRLSRRPGKTRCRRKQNRFSCV